MRGSDDRVLCEGQSGERAVPVFIAARRAVQSFELRSALSRLVGVENVTLFSDCHVRLDVVELVRTCGLGDLRIFFLAHKYFPNSSGYRNGGCLGPQSCSIDSGRKSITAAVDGCPVWQQR